MSRCHIISKYCVIKITRNHSSKCRKPVLTAPRAMRLMMLIKPVKLFVLQVSPPHYRSLILVLIHSVPQKLKALLTLSVTSETTNTNSLLPNTASNDIQQHVNSAKWWRCCHFDSDSCNSEVMVP
jgi:hypothetical protein